MKRQIIGVMGPGMEATDEEISNAYKLGQLIAERGWVALTGGRNTGVMNATLKGAKSKEGLTVGILPDGDDKRMSESVEIGIFTNMSSGRNYINALSSDIIVAVGMDAGTSSEISLAIKANKPVILLNQDEEIIKFFKKLRGQINTADSPEKVIEIIESLK